MHIKRLAVILIAAPFGLACMLIGSLTGVNSTSSPPTTEPTIEPTMDLGVTSWALESEIPYGFDGTLGENIFKVVIEPKRIDGSGGELLVHMTPANDLSCDQKFVIKWDFERDVSVVHEEDTNSLVLTNLPQGSGELLDCYRKAKSSMVYGNFTIHMSAGAVFAYDVTYLYTAITGQ